MADGVNRGEQCSADSFSILVLRGGVGHVGVILGDPLNDFTQSTGIMAPPSLSIVADNDK